MRTIISEKRLRAMLEEKILNEAEVQIDPTLGIEDDDKARSLETISYVKLLEKKQIFAVLHELTMTHIKNEGRDDLVKISNFLKGFKRTTSGGKSLLTLVRKEKSGNKTINIYDNTLILNPENNTYSFSTSGKRIYNPDTITTPGEIYNPDTMPESNSSLINFMTAFSEIKSMLPTADEEPVDEESVDENSLDESTKDINRKRARRYKRKAYGQAVDMYGSDFVTAARSKKPTDLVSTNTFLEAFEVSETNVNQFVSRCLGTSGTAQDGSGYPTNSGERVEIAMAAALAAINRGIEYGAKQDNAGGKDIIQKGSATYFELKYSDQGNGAITSKFSASPPTTFQKNKYFIFLSSDRAYFVHCPLLARVMTFGTDAVPLDDSAIENAKFNTTTIFYLINQEELKLRVIEAMKKLYTDWADGGDDIPYPSSTDKLNVFIECVNQDQDSVETMVDTLRKLFLFNFGPASFRSGGQKGEQSIIPVSLPTYDTEEEAIEEFNSVLTSDGKLMNYEEMVNTRRRYINIFISVLSRFFEQLEVAWGLANLTEAIVARTPKTYTGPEGSGTPGASGRIDSVYASGINYTEYLSDSRVTNDAKAMYLFGVLNQEMPEEVAKQITQKIKSKEYNNVLEGMRNDRQCVKKMLKEILRGSVGRNLVITHLNSVTRGQLTRINEYLNVLLMNGSLGNKFWTKFERSGDYDELLWNVFLADNPITTEILKDDPELGTFSISIVEQVIQELQINFEDPNEYLGSLEKTNLEERLESFESFLKTSTGEVVNSQIALFNSLTTIPQKSKFIKSFAALYVGSVDEISDDILHITKVFDDIGSELSFVTSKNKTPLEEYYDYFMSELSKNQQKIQKDNVRRRLGYYSTNPMRGVLKGKTPDQYTHEEIYDLPSLQAEIAKIMYEFVTSENLKRFENLYSNAEKKTMFQKGLVSKYESLLTQQEKIDFIETLHATTGDFNEEIAFTFVNLRTLKTNLAENKNLYNAILQDIMEAAIKKGKSVKRK